MILEEGYPKRKWVSNDRHLFISHIIVKNKRPADGIVLPSLTCGFQEYTNHERKSLE